MPFLSFYGLQAVLAARSVWQQCGALVYWSHICGIDRWWYVHLFTTVCRRNSWSKVSAFHLTAACCHDAAHFNQKFIVVALKWENKLQDPWSPRCFINAQRHNWHFIWIHRWNIFNVLSGAKNLFTTPDSVFRIIYVFPGNATAFRKITQFRGNKIERSGKNGGKNPSKYSTMCSHSSEF